MNDKTTKDRRKFLSKTVLAGIGILSVGPSVVSGTNGAQEFRGIAYDPVSGDLFGDASGKLNTNDNFIAGQFSVGGKTYPVNTQALGQLDNLSKFRSHLGNEYTSKGRPTRIKMISTNDNEMFSAIVIDPRIQERVGILMSRRNSRIPISRLKKEVR